MLNPIMTNQTKNLSLEILSEIERFGRLFPNRFDLLLRTPAPALDRLNSLGLERQTQILNGFRMSVDQIQAAAEVDPESLHDERRLLRQVARQMRLVISEEAFNLIEKDDIIEIYNSDFIQVYRGLNFMSISNYTLIDLLTYEFQDLCERSMVVNQYIFDGIEKARRSGTLAGVSMDHVPPHLMRECFAQPQGVFEIKFRHYFPVYRWPMEYFGTLALMKATPYRDLEKLEGVKFL